MMKVTYEEFKRVNNMLKMNFHNSGLHNRVMTITKVSFKNNEVKIKAIDNPKEWQESINTLVAKVLKGMTCISNPSILEKWNGFINEANVANADQKQKMQSILLKTVAEDLSDTMQTFEAICVLKFGLDTQDIKKMRQGIMPKYNSGLYKNIIKYILGCKCPDVERKLILQGIVLS